MLNEAVIDRAVEQYIAERDRFEKLASAVARTCTDIIAHGRVRALVSSRTKRPESLRGKLVRYLNEGRQDKIELLDGPRSVLLHVGDLSAVRVATYAERDRGRAVDLVRQAFDADKSGSRCRVNIMDRETGYRAVHCQVLLAPEILSNPGMENLRSTSCEVQVCGMFSHLWNEVEHDIRYKTHGADPASDQEVLDLEELERVVQSGDAVVDRLNGRHAERVARLLKGSLAARGFAESAELESIAFVMARLGYETPDSLVGFFARNEFIERNALERVNQRLAQAGSQAQFPDSKETRLLGAFLEAHIGELVMMLREEAGDWLPEPIRSAVQDLASMA